MPEWRAAWACLRPRGTTRGATSIYASEFVSAALRHAEHAPEDLDAGDVPPLVPAVHALAQRLAKDEADPNAAATIAEVDTLFAQLEAFAPLLAYAGSAECAADQVPRLEGELAWARTSLADAATYAADLRTKLETAQTYNTDLLATLQRKEGELVAAHAKLQRIGAHVLGRIVLRRIER